MCYGIGNIHTYIITRVADLVHFRPDPANQNFKNRIRILLALTKNQFNHVNFCHMYQISSDISMIFNLKIGKIHLKMCKSSIFFNILFLLIQLYMARLWSGSEYWSGENFPDPDLTGSRSATLIITKLITTEILWFLRKTDRTAVLYQRPTKCIGT